VEKMKEVLFYLIWIILMILSIGLAMKGMIKKRKRLILWSWVVFFVACIYLGWFVYRFLL